MQAPTIVAGIVEKLLGKLLKFHPDPNPLGQWQGQIVQFQFKELKFPLVLLLSDPIQVFSQYEDKPDAVITLSLTTLSKMNDGSNLSSLVNEGHLDIEGDMQLVGKLMAIFSAIEPDLAEPLSKVVGDAMAYRIDQGAKRQLHFAKNNFSRFKHHSQEFIKEELKLVTAQEDLEWFSEQVEHLTKRSETLSQRVDKLEHSATRRKSNR